MIDLEVKNTYEVTDPKPERVPEKVKIIILMRNYSNNSNLLQNYTLHDKIIKKHRVILHRIEPVLLK